MSAHRRQSAHLASLLVHVMLLVGQVVGHALVLDALHADTIRLTIHIFHVHGLQGLEVRQGLGQIFLGRTHHGNTL